MYRAAKKLHADTITFHDRDETGYGNAAEGAYALENNTTGIRN